MNIVVHAACGQPSLVRLGFAEPHQWEAIRSSDYCDLDGGALPPRMPHTCPACGVKFAPSAGTARLLFGTGKSLKPGDWALTDYDGRVKRVRIVAEDRQRTFGHSQTGVVFQLEPGSLRHQTPDSWYDSAWFVPYLPRL